MKTPQSPLLVSCEVTRTVCGGFPTQRACSAENAVVLCCSVLPYATAVLILIHEPLTRYVNLRVAHAPGMPGTFSPPPLVIDPDMYHGTYLTHVSWIMSGSITCGGLWSRWREKRSRHSQRMRNPHCYESAKRPIILAVNPCLVMPCRSAECVVHGNKITPGKCNGINTLPPEDYYRHFVDDMLYFLFHWSLFLMDIFAHGHYLLQTVAWLGTGNYPNQTYMYYVVLWHDHVVTRPQWVNGFYLFSAGICSWISFRRICSYAMVRGDDMRPLSLESNNQGQLWVCAQPMRGDVTM